MRKTTKRKFAPVAKTKKGVPKKYVAGAKKSKGKRKRNFTNCKIISPGKINSGNDESY